MLKFEIMAGRHEAGAAKAESETLPAFLSYHTCLLAEVAVQQTLEGELLRLQILAAEIDLLKAIPLTAIKPYRPRVRILRKQLHSQKAFTLYQLL